MGYEDEFQSRSRLRRPGAETIVGVSVAPSDQEIARLLVNKTRPQKEYNLFRGLRAYARELLLKAHVRWVNYTEQRHRERRELDLLLYGNAFMVRRWWGWQYVHPKNYMMSVRNKNEDPS